MSGLRGRLVFDEGCGEYRDGAARYLMMRADVLMGLFAALPEAGRLPALQALGLSAAATFAPFPGALHPGAQAQGGPVVLGAGADPIYTP